MNEKLHKKFPLLLKEGWSGRLIILYTVFYFPTGVVDSAELDGNPHGEYHKIEKDKKRNQYLEGLGFSTLRFENRLVFQEPEFVKNEMRKPSKKRSGI
jgi:hypothetical protein